MDFAPRDDVPLPLHQHQHQPPDAGSHLGAVLALDDQALVGCIERARSGAGDHLAVDLGLTWLALMRGEAVSVEPSLTELFSRAAVTRDPWRVIEVTVLRALVALSMGKLADAVAFARRASLMARTEALPRAELLANLALARVRRHCGKPHLAVRILEALARVAPATPTGWLDWELLLAGGTRPDAPSASSRVQPQEHAQEHASEHAQDRAPAARAVGSARRLLLAARRGERAVFEREAAELLRATSTCRDIQKEGQALMDLLDADRPCQLASGSPLASGSLSGFRRGDHVEVAYGLFAAGVASDQQEPGTTIFVVARPRRPGVRILREGLGLFGPCRMLSCDDGARRTHGRTDAALAVLALSASSAMPEPQFFQQVYGFPYLDASHRGVLDVLVHRMRRRIAAAGAVSRSKGCLGLELREAIAVADPRCSPPAAARILSALARQPLATADAIAVRLGITVRAAQMALQQLVSDGACAMRRTGRAMEFQLQDSAFSEPTGHDVLPLVPAALRP
jgi:hypothetical protein